MDLRTLWQSVRLAPVIEARCSFCGKKQSQVKKVVAGPDDVYICNECISLCLEITSEEGVPMGSRGVVQTTESDPESDGWRWNDPHWKRRVSVDSVLALTVEAIRRGIGLREASAESGDARLTSRALGLVDVLNALSDRL